MSRAFAGGGRISSSVTARVCSTDRVTANRVFVASDATHRDSTWAAWRAARRSASCLIVSSDAAPRLAPSGGRPGCPSTGRGPQVGPEFAGVVEPGPGAVVGELEGFDHAGNRTAYQPEVDAFVRCEPDGLDGRGDEVLADRGAMGGQYEIGAPLEHGDLVGESGGLAPEYGAAITSKTSGRGASMVMLSGPRGRSVRPTSRSGASLPETSSRYVVRAARTAAAVTAGEASERGRMPETGRHAGSVLVAGECHSPATAVG